MVVQTLGLLCVIALGASAMDRDLDLTNDKEYLLSLFLKPPVDLHINFYLFNLTNPEQFAAGAKPIVQEVGPYVYREMWVKEDVNWINDGEIEYTPGRIFKFRKELSGDNRLADQITTVNFPLVSAMESMKNVPVAVAGVNAVIDAQNIKPYITKTVHELLWGFHDDLVKLGRDSLAPGTPGRYPFENVGLFVGKNGTSTKRIRVNTGLTDEGFRGKIKTVDGSSTIGFNSGNCDRVEGATNGYDFKPNLQKSDKLSFYNPDLCGALPFQYSRDVVLSPSGASLYQYSLHSDAFSNNPSNPESCICTTPGCSNIDGIQDMTKCSYDTPIYLSRPHFLNGDPKLRNDVEGMNPNPTRHDMYFNVEPITGKTLQAKVTGQINIHVKQQPAFPVAQNLPNDIIFPLFWFDDNTDSEVNPDTIDRVAQIVAKGLRQN